MVHNSSQMKQKRIQQWLDAIPCPHNSPFQKTQSLAWVGIQQISIYETKALVIVHGVETGLPISQHGGSSRFEANTGSYMSSFQARSITNNIYYMS